jgi:hypothetical protein
MACRIPLVESGPLRCTLSGNVLTGIATAGKKGSSHHSTSKLIGHLGDKNVCLQASQVIVGHR